LEPRARLLTETKAVQTEFWIPTQRKDQRQVLAQIETCQPVYFQRESGLKMFTIRILEHPSLSTAEWEDTSLIVDSDPQYQPTGITQDGNSTGEGVESQTSQQMEVTSRYDEQEGACCELSGRGPVGASVNSLQVAASEDYSALDKVEGGPTHSLQDIISIALNKLANMTISAMKGNSQQQHWEGEGSSRVELLPIPIGVTRRLFRSSILQLKLSVSQSQPSSEDLSAEEKRSFTFSY